MPLYRVPTLQTPLDLEETPRRVVIVTNRASSSLEYISFLQVFAETTFFLEQSGYCPAYEVEVVSRGKGCIYERNGLSITASRSFDELEGSVDTLIIQAADDHDECLRDNQFIDWVKVMAKKVRRIVSACTGSFILAEAGLLDGKPATTHWAAAEDFRTRYPEVRLTPERIHVKSGNIHTAAGVTAATDLAIALVEEDLGAELARRVAQAMVVFMKRPGNQAQFFATSTHSVTKHHLDLFANYIHEHLSGDLRLETLADHFNLSLRSFNRQFRKRVGIPPGRYVEQCRIDRARRYLEESTAPISQIAQWCGYETSDGLCLAFERNLGITPRQYRKRFSSSLQNFTHSA